MTETAAVHTLLRDLRQALVFQRELGLNALEVDERLLRMRRVSGINKPSGTSQSPESAVQFKGANPEEAREEIARLLQQGGTGSKAAAPKPSGGRDDFRAMDLGQNQVVVGAGDPNARLMFIGEASRRDVELLGEPFVGKTGELLTKMIQAMGLKRGDVYLSNVVKPRAARSKQAQALSAMEPFVRAQIESVRPEVIVTFGDFSTQLLLGETAPLAKLRGQWRDYRGIAVIPTFHPAELLRDASLKKPVWVDLQTVMQRLGLK